MTISSSCYTSTKYNSIGGVNRDERSRSDAVVYRNNQETIIR